MAKIKDDPNGKKKRVNPIVNPVSLGAAGAALGTTYAAFAPDINAGVKKAFKNTKKAIKKAFTGSPKRTSEGVVKRKK